MLATTTSKRAGGSASGDTNARVDAVGRRVGGAGADRLRIDVDARHAPGAELRRGDRENARAAPVVEHRFAAADRCAQPQQAQPRGRMRSGAERESRIEAQVERTRIGRLRPRRHDEEVAARSRSARTAPASCAPSPRRRRDRSRTQAAASATAAARAIEQSRRPARRRRSSATTRDVAQCRPRRCRARRTSATRGRCPRTGPRRRRTARPRRAARRTRPRLRRPARRSAARDSHA